MYFSTLTSRCLSGWGGYLRFARIPVQAKSNSNCIRSVEKTSFKWKMRKRYLNFLLLKFLNEKN